MTPARRAELRGVVIQALHTGDYVTIVELLDALDAADARAAAAEARERALREAADNLLKALDLMHAGGAIFTGRVSVSASSLRQLVGHNARAALAEPGP